MRAVKRIASVFLCIPLALALVPAAAFAVDDDTSTSVELSDVGPVAHWNIVSRDYSTNYIEVENSATGEKMTNQVTVTARGTTSASKINTALERETEKRRQVREMDRFGLRITLQIQGNTGIDIDEDLAVDYFSSDGNQPYSLTITGDSVHSMEIRDSGMQVTGNFTMKSGVLKLAALSGSALATGGTCTLAGGVLTARGQVYGISSGGDLTISSPANVTASAANDLPYYTAIRGYGSISIEGGKVVASDGSQGICASSGITISGGTIDAQTATNSGVAVFARKGIEVVSPVKVKTPIDYEVVSASARAGGSAQQVDGYALGAQSAAATTAYLVTENATSQADVEGSGGSGAGANDGNGGNTTNGEGGNTGKSENTGEGGSNGSTDGNGSDGGNGADGKNDGNGSGGQDGSDGANGNNGDNGSNSGGTTDGENKGDGNGGSAGEGGSGSGTGETGGSDAAGGSDPNAGSGDSENPGNTGGADGTGSDGTGADGTGDGTGSDNTGKDNTGSDGTGGNTGSSGTGADGTGDGTGSDNTGSGTSKSADGTENGSTTNSGGDTSNGNGLDASKDSTSTSGNASTSNESNNTKGNTGSSTSSSVKSNISASASGVPTGEKDSSGSTFHLMCASVKKVTKTTTKLTWKKPAGATQFEVWGTPCGAGNRYKFVELVAGKSYTHRGLKPGKYYRYFIVARSASGKIVAKSKTIHAATTGGKYTNFKSVATNAKKLHLKKGSVAYLTATAKKKDTTKKVNVHKSFRFESSNKKVAKVNSKGKITAKGAPGSSCTIYTYAQNGVYAKTKVTIV